MLRRQLVLGFIMVVLTVLFHVACLVALADLLDWLSQLFSTRSRVLEPLTVMGVSVLCILAVHVAEAWAWAAIYQRLGEFDDIAAALYFSVVTCTTLGYGDLRLSERWRVLASLQAIGGLILFGATTAFCLRIMEQAFTSR